MTAPQFSICIPVFNGQKYLDQTLKSVLAQSFTDFEIVVVDNNSQDQTSEILRACSDPRLRVISNTETVPAWMNWTLAVQAAKGQWTKLLCADDLLSPDSLKIAHQDFMNFPAAHIHAGTRDVVGPAGQSIFKSRKSENPTKILEETQLIKKVLSTGTNPFGEGMCVTWKSDLTSQVGSFSSHWRYFIDLDYWLRLSALSSVIQTSKQLGSFRVSPESWTSSIGLGAATESIDFFTNHESFKLQSRMFRMTAIGRAASRGVARKVFLLSVNKKQIEA